jgi:tRNA A37 threonylcarbamoyladenosine dehydratase
MDDFYTQMTNRTEMVLGSAALERLSRARVVVFGVGGVGSWCAEALVRTGLLHLTVVDADIICPTNVNRQLQATARTIGGSKVGEIKRRFLEINPSADIEALHAAFDESSCGNFSLPSYDYVVDAIDTLKDKVLLLEQCIGSGVRFFSSMGAGSRTDPSRIRVGALSATVNCPLARAVRRALRKKSLSTDFTCVYSDEPPAGRTMETRGHAEKCESAAGMEGWPGRKSRVNGSLVHITAVFGFTLAGLVINDIRGKGA